MNLKIDAKELTKAAKLVSSVITSKPVKPILGCALLKDGYISATDLETTIKTKLGDFDGAVAVDGKKLASIAGTLTGEVTIERHEMVLKIKAKRTKLELPLMDELSYPPVAFQDVPTTELDGAWLKNVLTHVVYAASTDDYMRNLNSVYWETLENSTRWVAADGFRLAMYESNHVGEPGTRLLSLKTVQNLMRLLTNEPVQFGFDDSRMMFKNGDTTMYSRLLDIDFPDYRKVIPPKCNVEILAKKSALIHALQVVQQVVAGSGESAKLQVSGNELIISGKSHDIGTVETRVEIQNDANGEIKAAYNEQFLQDAIKHVDTEEVLLRITDNIGPLQIQTAIQKENVDHIAIVMPVRIN